MELLLLLFPLLLLGGLGGGGGGEFDDAEPSAQTGTAANEVLAGDVGSDLITGEAGNDILIGAAGDDVLTGGAGSDGLLAGSGNDTLSGGTGNDYLQGGAGNDSLVGGNANDTLIGSSGSDTLAAGDGSDILIGLEYDKLEPLFADEGDALAADLISLLDDTVSAEVRTALVDGVTSGSLTESGTDVLLGGAGNDTLIGDDGDTMTGEAGADSFAVWHDPDQAPSVITDFDPTVDRLAVLVADPATASVRFVAGGPGDITLLVNDVVAVAFTSGTLQALTANGSPWLTLDARSIA